MTEPPGKFVAQEIKFAWLDEDGDQVSPTHEQLRSALSFIADWPRRWERFVARWEVWERAPRHVREPLTRTGKPPVQLEQRITRTYAAPLTDEQQKLIEVFMA